MITELCWQNRFPTMRVMVGYEWRPGRFESAMAGGRTIKNTEGCTSVLAQALRSLSRVRRGLMSLITPAR